MIKFGRAFLILMMGFFAGYGQDIDSYNVHIREGYAQGSLNAWQEGALGLKHLYEQGASAESAYSYALAQYGLIGFYLAEERTRNQAAPLIEQTLALVKACLEQFPQKGEFSALMGGLYGLKIGLSPAKGIYLGPRSMRYLNNAIAQSPDHPAVWVEMGNARYHSPSLFGGSKAEAIKCFKKALSLFEQKPPLQNTWLYLHTLAWLGQAYEAEKQKALAISTYEKALEKQGNFLWIKEELLPNALGK